MKKNPDEFLHQPDNWNQRDKYEKSGFSRFPGLLTLIVLTMKPGDSKAKILREIKDSISKSGLMEVLHLLGRIKDVSKATEQAAHQFLSDL